MKKCSVVYSANRPSYDKSDCCVRALMVAGSCGYEQASAMFSAAGRVLNKDAPVDVTDTVYIKWLGMRKVESNCELAVFVVLNPRGRFILHRRGHAFALIDGVVHDWDTGTFARTQVTRAWEMTELGMEKLKKAGALFA